MLQNQQISLTRVTFLQKLSFLNRFTVHFLLNCVVYGKSFFWLVREKQNIGILIIKYATTEIDKIFYCDFVDQPVFFL